MVEVQERLVVAAAGDRDEFEVKSFFSTDGDAFAFLQHMAEVLKRIVAPKDAEEDLPECFAALLHRFDAVPELRPVG